MEIQEALSNIVNAHEAYFRGLPAEQRAIQQSLQTIAAALDQDNSAKKADKPKKKEPDGNTKK